MKRALLVVAIVVLLAVLAGGTQQYGVPYVINVGVRGRRLNTTSIDGDKSIAETPAALAAAAAAIVGRPVDVNALALGRMLRSEEGSQPAEVKALIAHVAINEAHARGVSLVDLLTASTVASRNGKLGRQISRWASTAADLYEDDLGVAEQVIAARASGGADPTGGARKFVDRLAFGVQPGTGSFADLKAKWATDGYKPENIPPAPLRLVFFTRGAIPANAEPVADAGVTTTDDEGIG